MLHVYAVTSLAHCSRWLRCGCRSDLRVTGSRGGFASRWPQASWAIECAGGLGALRQLDVHPGRFCGPATPTDWLNEAVGIPTHRYER